MQTDEPNDSSGIEYHLSLVSHDDNEGDTRVSLSGGAPLEHLKNAPLFTSRVQSAIEIQSLGAEVSSAQREQPAYPQYGLLCLRVATCEVNNIEGTSDTEDGKIPRENLVYANINEPWSAFICGSQGSGKSHSLSCLLENSLLSNSGLGRLSEPLTGLIFHYDKFNSFASAQVCEAAYLCSSGIPVRVLVSSSNLSKMTQVYSNLPGLPADSPKPQVVPLYFEEKHLNIGMMKSLMAAGSGDGPTPLYLQVIYKILRDMARETQDRPGLDYQSFKNRLKAQNFMDKQNPPMQMRLDLLESFLDPSLIKPEAQQPKERANGIWTFEKGTLTIIDLSCPFVDSNDACALFNICLSISLDGRKNSGRIIALDEAHKFLNESHEAADFTESLLSVIRQQRHLGTRVIIATQEPTLSPKLLDLCNVTLVHRFTSPAWFRSIEGHIAGASLTSDHSGDVPNNLFKVIVGLRTGEALLFCPTAAFDVVGGDGMRLTVKELGSGFARIRIRKRVTVDGGRSIMATGELEE